MQETTVASQKQHRGSTQRKEGREAQAIANYVRLVEGGSQRLRVERTQATLREPVSQCSSVSNVSAAPCKTSAVSSAARFRSFKEVTKPRHMAAVRAPYAEKNVGADVVAGSDDELAGVR
jgi:hypothetical protein